ncbi:hypothetical protein [Dickeya chrysanthemi]|uniref:hypothetical protein n=1 Tax=Dickeya chrysanthemi TaxID=556 RepID=UPI001EE650C0|nr:hypothetical protein [Dickeya chrysanthemi]
MKGLTDNTVTQTPPLLDHWLGAKLCRFAVPSAFAFAVRVARDAFPTRHELSQPPCCSPGEVARLSTVFDAEKNRHLAIKGVVSNIALSPIRFLAHPARLGVAGTTQRRASHCRIGKQQKPVRSMR